MASQPSFAVFSYRGVYCEFFARLATKLRKNNPRYMARAKAQFLIRQGTVASLRSRVRNLLNIAE